MDFQEKILSSILSKMSAATDFEELEPNRKELIEFCFNSILNDHSKGKEMRETLWREGYLDHIKKIKAKWPPKKKVSAVVENLANLLNSGIACFKDLSLKLAQRCNIDLSSLFGESIDTKNDEVSFNETDENYDAITSNMDSLHFILICLGDLYCCCIQYRIDPRELKITKQHAVICYEMAFKLKPSNGIAQYKLGGISNKSNCDIDRIYHYMYAMVCTIPAELSEPALCNIIESYKKYLQELHSTDMEFNLRDFYARFYLMVDVFFYEREVNDLKIICQGVMHDFIKLLNAELYSVGEDVLFKLICLLFFSLSKLQMIDSPKVGFLKLFLLSVCSELVKACSRNLEQYILQNNRQSKRFHEIYNRKFVESSKVKKSGDGPQFLNGLFDQIQTGNENSKVSGQSKDKKTTITTKTLKRKSRRRKRNPGYSSSDSESFFQLDTDNSEGELQDSTDSLNSSSSESSFEDKSFSSSDADDEDENVVEKRIDTVKNLPLNANPKRELENKPDYGEQTSSNNDNNEMNEKPMADGKSGKLSATAFEYKSRHQYGKTDPNIIIDFAIKDPTLRCLKLILDWLQANPAVLLEFHQFQPEFLRMAMKLLDLFNIDIFRPCLYFEREFLTTPNVRIDIGELYKLHAKIPLQDDFAFKNFHIFQSSQISLDWNSSYSQQLTKEEEVMVRLFRVVDFGFFICHNKQFKYYFCTGSRHFVEGERAKRRRNNGQRRSVHREERFVQHVQQKRQARNARNDRRTLYETGQKVLEESEPSSSNMPNRKNSESDEAQINKNRIMYNLWIENEVNINKEKLVKEQNSVAMTPYIVVDTNALVTYTGNVKSLVFSKKFIIIVPLFVLNDLDRLKKTNENARRVIRWLEQEFKYGNCHIRAQRKEETSPVSMSGLPSRLDQGAHQFMEIARICKYMVGNRVEIGAGHFDSIIVTYLYGNYMKTGSKKTKNFNYYDILDSLPARYEQIAVFHKKFMRNS